MSGPHPAAAAIAKLYELAKAAIEPVRDTQVDFGPAPIAAMRALGIGVDPDTLSAAPVDVVGAPGSDTLTVDLPCSALARGGGTSSRDQVKRMLAAFEVVDLLRDVLAAHPQLDLPCVSSVHIVREQYQPTDDPGAVVGFAVRIFTYRSL